MGEARRRLLFIAIVASIIVAGSCYGYWQRNSVLESTSVALQPEKIPQQSMVTVYISGAVIQPGVVKVTAGTKVIEVINVAGGLAEGAEVSKLNLAQTVKDGMHIQVPRAKQTPANAIHQDMSKRTSGMVNINTADQKELDSLPGIGSALAQQIVDYRRTNGLFKDPEQLKNIPGIGESKYNKLKDKITL